MLCVAVPKIAGLKYLFSATEHAVQLCSSPGWSASQIGSVSDACAALACANLGEVGFLLCSC